jgi:hypothetical protein
MDEWFFKNMKLNTLIFALAASTVALTGCQYPNGAPNNTGTGALPGARLARLPAR